jgi:hypothetical protein
MSRIKYRFANFLRGMGNWFLQISQKLLPTKIDYSQEVEERLIRDFVPSNQIADETNVRKVKKKRKRRNWLRKTFITIGILAGIVVMYVVCAEIYYKIIWPRQAATDDECLLQEARIHPEKAEKIAIIFYERYKDNEYNHCVRWDPCGIMHGKCQYDHYTAYKTALNVYVQYTVDNLHNNIEIFNALSGFNVYDSTINSIRNAFFDKVKTDAENGDAQSQYCIACEYERRGRSVQESLQEFYINSLNEDYASKHKHERRGRSPNYCFSTFEEKAAYWFLKAAEQGYLAAMTSLAECYLEGFGVVKSIAKAKEWYEKAAYAGDGYSMICLGDMYRDGKGIMRDIVLAKYWWEKARETGKWKEEIDVRLQKIYN